MILYTFTCSFMRRTSVNVDFTNTAQTKLSSREPIILGFLGRSFTKMWTGNLFHFTVRVPKNDNLSEELPSKKLHSMVNWILKFLLSCLHKLFITGNNLLQLSKLGENKKQKKKIFYGTFVASCCTYLSSLMSQDPLYDVFQPNIFQSFATVEHKMTFI